MIFVTVGNHDAPFDRLVQRMDVLAGQTEEPVWMQIGPAKVRPTHASFRRHFNEEEWGRMILKSRTIVSHAGTGTLLAVAQSRKPLVCLPRQRRFGEAWDDHQLEICSELARSGTLCYVEKPEELSLQTLARAKPPAFPQSATRLTDRIHRFLRETAAGRSPDGSHP